MTCSMGKPKTEEDGSVNKALGEIFAEPEFYPDFDKFFEEIFWDHESNPTSRRLLEMFQDLRDGYTHDFLSPLDQLESLKGYRGINAHLLAKFYAYVGSNTQDIDHSEAALEGVAQAFNHPDPQIRQAFQEVTPSILDNPKIDPDVVEIYLIEQESALPLPNQISEENLEEEPIPLSVRTAFIIKMADQINAQGGPGSEPIILSGKTLRNPNELYRFLRFAQSNPDPEINTFIQSLDWDSWVARAEAGEIDAFFLLNAFTDFHKNEKIENWVKTTETLYPLIYRARDHSASQIINVLYLFAAKGNECALEVLQDIDLKPYLDSVSELIRWTPSWTRPEDLRKQRTMTLRMAGRFGNLQAFEAFSGTSPKKS